MVGYLRRRNLRSATPTFDILICGRDFDYSDVSTIHDYVVESDGAFDETIRGILNLKSYGQKVEIRIVVHRQTYARCRSLPNF